jgi:hypothetical protein
MINFKYGIGFSLLQVNSLGLVDPANPVTAGMVAYIDSSTGMIEPGVPASNAAVLPGFAFNSSTDSDVLSCGKIGLLILDGNTVVETDQADSIISEGNYPDGTPLHTTAAGLVTTSTSYSTRVIGYAAGVRQLPGRAVNITASTGAVVAAQGPITVLAIKLNA